jgi:hypothetical protein
MEPADLFLFQTLRDSVLPWESANQVCWVMQVEVNKKSIRGFYSGISGKVLPLEGRMFG